MKKIFLIVIFVLALCVAVACDKGERSRSTKLPPINCEWGYHNFIVFGDDAYYILCGGLIARWDGEVDHQAIPICKKPDCSHDQPECCAFVNMEYPHRKMFYLDGSLYLFGRAQEDSVTKSHGFPMWKVAADGSSKEIAFFASDFPNMYTVLGDVAYYDFCQEDENGKLITTLWAQPLQGGEETLIWKSELQNGGLDMIQGINGQLYFSEYGVDQSIDLENIDTGFDNMQREYNLYTYQPETGEVKRDSLFQKEDGSIAVIWNFFDGDWYYSYHTTEENVMWRRPEGGSGDAVCLGKMPKYVNAADPLYMYSGWWVDRETKSGEVSVYDYNQNLIQRIQFPMEDTFEWLPATEDYVFGYYEKPINEEARIEKSVILLERDKLADGAAEMITLIQR